MSIEELSTELGISAPYVEDEVKYLVENQLMKEISGKYQTDFVVLPGNVSTATEIYESCFPGYFNDLMAFLEKHKDLLTSEQLNKAGLPGTGCFGCTCTISPTML